jgi:hypothetical protein
MSLVLLLKDLHLLSPELLESAEQRARSEGVALVHLLVREGLVDDELIARVLAVRMRIDRIDLDTRSIDSRIIALLPPVLAVRYRVVPVGLRRTREGDVLYAAMSSPDDDLAFMEVQAATGLRLFPLVAPDQAISRALTRVYGIHANHLPTQTDLVVPDIESRARVIMGMPIVVGEIIPEALHVTAPHAHALPSLDPVADDALADEWLMPSTQEVLAAHAPVLDPASPDFEWLRTRRETSRAHQSPLIDTTALVCGDIGLRSWLVGRLHHAIPDLYEFARLDEVAEFAASGALVHLVLINPATDARIMQILSAIADTPAPPRVVVISPNRAFEVMRGVSRRLDPLVDDENLAVSLLAVLYREQT